MDELTEAIEDILVELAGMESLRQELTLSGGDENLLGFPKRTAQGTLKME